jgi:hypothetical protein
MSKGLVDIVHCQAVTLEADMLDLLKKFFFYREKTKPTAGMQE